MAAMIITTVAIAAGAFDQFARTGRSRRKLIKDKRILPLASNPMRRR
jgi:hypothetical protein